MPCDSVVKERSEVILQDSWNVSALYKNVSEWEKDFQVWGRPDRMPRYPELAASHVQLTDPKEVRKFLDLYMEIDRRLSLVYTYAHLRHDEDVAEEVFKKSYALALRSLYALQEEVSWLEPALLQLSQETLERLLSSEELKEYQVYLKKIVRLKPHTLSSEEEKLLARSEKAVQTSRRAFRALNDADLKFPSCKDSEGKVYELTHGMYSVYMKSKDRTLRKEAFLHLHETFGLYENTLCELLEGQVQAALFKTKARNYNSCLEAALYPYEIDVEVYHSLIRTMKEGLPILHDFLEFRRQYMGYSDLHPYDLNAPMVDEVDIQMTYDEAVEVIVESVAPLGEEYQKILRKGLLEDRWVDRYENKRKRSGAYSSGCYDSMPYILMNYHGTLSDVMTLAHEAGHSMHSYFSHQHQPYQNSSYSIFVAEVASTFHEELLFDALLKKAKNSKEKAYLINQRIDGIRNTFFRQAMFAEFELAIHQWAEAGEPLTPALLKEKYLELNRECFGKAVTVDDCLAWEWSRIPHFYSSFYVYQYATGISAACSLARKVLAGEQGAAKRYVEFISAGSSADPLTVLKRAGVDMRSQEPVESLLQYFKTLSEEFKQLLKTK